MNFWSIYRLLIGGTLIGLGVAFVAVELSQPENPIGKAFRDVPEEEPPIEEAV